MKINIVTSFFLPVPPVLGGSTEKIWFRLAAEFTRRGHEVTLISRAWPGFAADDVVDGVRHRRVRGHAHSRWLGCNLLHDIAWGRRVARVLPAADVVICNTVTLPIWLRRVKPAAGRVIAVIARMPKGHGRFYGGVDRLFALSEAVAAALRAENPRLSDRIVPMPYPLDWALQAGAARQNMAGTLTIGFVGRVHPEKGIPLLLAAAEQLARRTDLPDWRLEIVGPSAISAGGGGEAWRDGLIRKFGPALGGRLIFREPEFDPAGLAQRYGRMDVFCYPSLAVKGETFGLAVAEAMAAGCAPVVSALACFREVVRDGETGVVFDHTAADAEVRLADVLAGLLSDTGRRQAIARRGQEFVRRYDYAVVADTVLGHLAALRAEQS